MLGVGDRCKANLDARRQLGFEIWHDRGHVERMRADRLCNFATLQNLGSTWPQVRLHSNHGFDEAFQICGVHRWRVVELTLDNPLEEFVHVARAERRVQR